MTTQKPTNPFSSQSKSPPDSAGVAEPLRPPLSESPSPAASPGKAQRTPGDEKNWRADGKSAAAPQRDSNGATSGAAAAAQKPAASPNKKAEPLTERQHQAITVRDAVVPTLMQMAMTPKDSLDIHIVRGYRDELLREMGDPADPLERMMIEQAAVAHVVSLQLLSFVASCKTPAETSLYAASAARLMAETRRMILGVREYRSPLVRQQVTKIEQQNVAERQEVHYAAGVTGDVQMACRDKNNPDTRQARNDKEVGSENVSQVGGAGDRWAKEPAVAGTAVG
jgi:hypothetical protein